MMSTMILLGLALVLGSLWAAVALAVGALTTSDSSALQDADPSDRPAADLGTDATAQGQAGRLS